MGLFSSFPPSVPRYCHSFSLQWKEKKSLNPFVRERVLLVTIYIAFYGSRNMLIANDGY